MVKYGGKSVGVEIKSLLDETGNANTKYLSSLLNIRESKNIITLIYTKTRVKLIEPNTIEKEFVSFSHILWGAVVIKCQVLTLRSYKGIYV